MYHLLSFADSRLRRSLVRLEKQAKAFHLFDSLNLLDETQLPSQFKEKFKDKLIPGSRGFGYWVWKPEIIFNALSNLNDGECLLYVDVGCHLNLKGKKRLVEYFELLKSTEKGVVAFQANTPTPQNSSLKYDGRQLFDQPNYQWIKGDVFDFFGVRDDPNFTHTQQIGSGVILLRKCEFAIKLIKEWRDICQTNFNLLDDSPSVSTDLPSFIENRHDQAIWTLLCIKNDIETVSAYEYWYPQKGNQNKTKPDWKALKYYPIHAKRDKDPGLIQKVNLAAKKYWQLLRSEKT